MPDRPRKPEDTKNNTSGKSTRFMNVDDARLWAEYRKTVRPLSRDAAQIAHGPVGGGPQPDAALPDSDALEAEFRAALADRPATVNHKSDTGESARQKVRQRPASSPPVMPSPLDRREQRRLATGRTAIEARLDLHGHRRHEAYDELRAFILRCRAQGLRHVLVITGKGNRSPEDEGEFYVSEPVRGVLRQQVPQWLSEPALQAHIIGFEQAHLRHGGEGALYVRLRRRR